jgi:uncharacterized phage protein gp47/JayE
MPIFGIPTWAELKPEVVAVYKALRPDASVAEGSDVDIKATTLTHMVHGLHMTLWYGLLYNILITKSSGWVLDAWLWVFGLSNGSGGFGRIVARGATADDGFTFVADAGPYSDLNGETFTDSAGNRYQVNESYTPSGAGTTPALDVIAIEWPEDNGAATNIEAATGETYTWESQPSYMTSTITQVVDLDGGANRETDSEGRARLVRRLQTPPTGGNWAHWEEIAEETSPGNIDAFIWEGLHNDTHGFGNTDIACTQRNELYGGKEIQTSDAIYDDIFEQLETQLPYGVLFRSRFLEARADTQELEVTITLNPNAPESLRCDWDAETPRFTVNASSEVNKTIRASADVTSYISVGDRVIIYSAQAIVSKVGTADGLADDNTFEVQTWFTVEDDDINPFPWTIVGFSPTGSAITSGGGIMLELHRKARDATFKRLGPKKKPGGAAYDNSAPIPAWEDTLREQQIVADCISVGDASGDATIIIVNVIQPASDTLPIDGDDTKVYFLGLSEVVFWEDKL